MTARKRLAGAAFMILPWPVFLLIAKGLGFVSAWLLIATLLVSAFGLTLLISPAQRQLDQPDPSPLPHHNPRDNPQDR